MPIFNRAKEVARDVRQAFTPIIGELDVPEAPLSHLAQASPSPLREFLDVEAQTYRWNKAGRKTLNESTLPESNSAS